MPVNKPKAFTKGFTLVELVIGIIVFAIAMTLFLALLVPQARLSVEPIYQVRAAELGQALINEIASKPFDENSSRVGGFIRCNELNPATNTTTPCSVITLNPNGRDTYDDVDDYTGLNMSGSTIVNSLNETIQVGSPAYNIYQGFSANVVVVYDENLDGIDDGSNVAGNTKLITVTVTTPSNEQVVFSTYRTNY